MNHLRFRELFHEFSQKLEEQHVFYLDSTLGFSALHEKLLQRQQNTKAFLGNHELANDEFLDTCGTIYKELGGKDVTPVSLSPLMKQGDVKARTKENGRNFLILGANCIVSLYGYWEEYLRIEVGIAMGVLEEGAKNSEETRKILNQHVVSDLWGDLRILRNSITHKNGIASSDVAKCKIIRCFAPGQPIELDFEKMTAIFSLLASYRNELDRQSRPKRGVRLPWP
jgi:hypothetical protein